MLKYLFFSTALLGFVAAGTGCKSGSKAPATTEARPPADNKQAKPQKPTLHGSWELEKVYGAKEPFTHLFPQAKPTAVFDLRTNTVNGNNGCNSYNGPISLRTNTLTISDLVSTKKLCPGVNEQLFMTTIKMTNSYRIDDGKLILMMDDTDLLAFHAMP